MIHERINTKSMERIICDRPTRGSSMRRHLVMAVSQGRFGSRYLIKRLTSIYNFGAFFCTLTDSIASSFVTVARTSALLSNSMRSITLSTPVVPSKKDNRVRAMAFDTG